MRMCQKSVSARSQEKKGICFCVEKFEWYFEILSKKINREEYLGGKGFIVNLLSCIFWKVFIGVSINEENSTNWVFQF